MDSTRVTAILGGLAICDETLSLDEWWNMQDEAVYDQALYIYIRQHMPAIRDFLPTSDIPFPYLVRNYPPYTDTYPFGRPASPFLEDLNNPTGSYEVTKPGVLTEVVTIFSQAFQPEARYRVMPPGSITSEDLWGYGEVVEITFDSKAVSGDGFVPTYSANLKEVSALSNTSNITIRDESTISVATGGVTKTYHMNLVHNPDMIRRLVSELTQEDLIPYAKFWSVDYIEPLAPATLWAIVTCSPVRTLVTNPLGQRIGLAWNGQIINEIQNGVVSADGTDPHLILLPEISGEYVVEGIGVGNGRYKVAAVRIGPEARPHLGGYLSATISSSDTFRFTFKTPALIYLPLIMKGNQ